MYDKNVIEALAYLRLKARSDDSQVSQAINALDNAGIFAALDEQTDYASAEEILADSARRSLEQELGRSVEGGTVPPLDPAEWGDVTRADTVRHPQSADLSLAAWMIESIRPKGRKPSTD